MKSCKPIFYNDDIESILTFKNLHKTTRESFYYVYICVCIYMYSRKCFIVRVCVSICVYILKNAKTNKKFTATNLQIMVVMNEIVLIITL